MNDLAVTPQNALAILEKQDTPEAKAIIDYVQMIKSRNIAVLGTDEAFILTSAEGQIKAFKKALTLSAADGTLIQPLGYGDYIVSAQGYERWAEETGTSVIFPKEIMVGNEKMPNPYPRRDETNGRILAVHARAIAFRYSSMGIPQVSDWSTIFDTPSYRMIDLLAKAKKYPQAFKVLPVGIEPDVPEKGPTETWAPYPYDESIILWVNTSHNEVILWLSQIMNREKKAMDFAQTFAKRNALKHLSGIQKVPNWEGAKNGPSVWRFGVLSWRPTGNNIIKWDASQYADVQDRATQMADGGGSEEFTQIELKQGSELVSEEENFEALEAEVDPEDAQQSEKKPDTKENGQHEEENTDQKADLPKEVHQAMYISKQFPEEYEQAANELGMRCLPEELGKEFAIKVCQKVAELVDAQN